MGRGGKSSRKCAPAPAASSRKRRAPSKIWRRALRAVRFSPARRSRPLLSAAASVRPSQPPDDYDDPAPPLHRLSALRDMTLTRQLAAGRQGRREPVAGAALDDDEPYRNPRVIGHAISIPAVALGDSQRRNGSVSLGRPWSVFSSRTGVAGVGAADHPSDVLPSDGRGLEVPKQRYDMVVKVPPVLRRAQRAFVNKGMLSHVALGRETEHRQRPDLTAPSREKVDHGLFHGSPASRR